jgi:HK97 family phage portal protein
MGRVRDWLFGPPKEEQRSITSLPWGESTPFNIGPSRYENTTDALSLGAVYAAIQLLAGSISTLPVDGYRKIGDQRVPMGSLPQLFAQLATDGTTVPWLHRAVTSLALRGNAYGLVVDRDGFGFPTVLDWLDPADISYDDSAGMWRWRGREIPRENIVHIPWFTVAGKREGLSPIASFASTLGVGLGAMSYSTNWFVNGGFPPGTFRNTEKPIPDKTEAATIRAQLASSIRSGQPMVYGKDWEFTAISVPAEEAQFLSTMKMTTNQIAAIYGIPPEMIGGESGSSMTYANVEQQQINFVMFTLRPWLVTLETAFSALLPDRQYVKFNSDALIRADLATRYNSYATGLTSGFLTMDEVRAMEDREPLPDKPTPAIPAPPADASTNPTVVPMRRPG